MKNNEDLALSYNCQERNKVYLVPEGNTFSDVCSKDDTPAPSPTECYPKQHWPASTLINQHVFAGRPRSPLHWAKTKRMGWSWGEAWGWWVSPGSSSSKLGAKVSPRVPAGSAVWACGLTALMRLACSTLGWHLQMPWTSVNCLSGHSETSSRALGFNSITTVRSLACRLSDLPWRHF